MRRQGLSAGTQRVREGTGPGVGVGRSPGSSPGVVTGRGAVLPTASSEA